MTTHVLISEPSVSECMTTPIGKGREGKRKGSRFTNALVKVRSTLAESAWNSIPNRLVSRRARQRRGMDSSC